MLEKFEGLSGDVSGVTLKTGATFTSNAVRDGVQAACARHCGDPVREGRRK